MNNPIDRREYLELCGVLLGAAAVIAVVVYCASIPIVEFSYSKGACVRVIAPAQYNCDNLPSRYESAWVK